MLSTTLASEMENMTPTSQESDVIDRFASAWETYFYESVVGVIPVNSGALASATTAMKAAMIGISNQNFGDDAIQAGIIAFWGIVASSASLIWTTVPPCTGATPPPALSTIASSLATVFTSNTTSKLNLSDSCIAIASAIHSLNLGGVCVIPSPGTSTPIT